MYFALLAPEIVIPPSSVTVFSNSTAEFTCHTRNAHLAYWRLNNTLVADYDTTNLLHNDVVIDTKWTIASGVITTLTIRARLKYHGLVVQCVAVVFGGAVVESENATLMVQGTIIIAADGVTCCQHAY